MGSVTVSTMPITLTSSLNPNSLHNKLVSNLHLQFSPVCPTIPTHSNNHNPKLFNPCQQAQTTPSLNSAPALLPNHSANLSPPPSTRSPNNLNLPPSPSPSHLHKRRSPHIKINSIISSPRVTPPAKIHLGIPGNFVCQHTSIGLDTLIQLDRG